MAVFLKSVSRIYCKSTLALHIFFHKDIIYTGLYIDEIIIDHRLDMDVSKNRVPPNHPFE